MVSNLIFVLLVVVVAAIFTLPAHGQVVFERDHYFEGASVAMATELLAAENPVEEATSVQVQSPVAEEPQTGEGTAPGKSKMLVWVFWILVILFCVWFLWPLIKGCHQWVREW